MASFTKTLDIAREHQETLRRMTQDLKASLTAAVENQPCRGKIINDGKTGGPLIMTVPFSALENWNLSPENYFPQMQAKLVAQQLDSCETIEAVVTKVRDIIRNNGIIHFRENGVRRAVQLSNVTLQTIKTSELGQYVLAETEKEI